ncbi:MAG: 1,6-anhydro-N-acetylmuramyl-L-alanine amidase AmpD [Coxiellaceae bacterium]|nr:MAG: 1,6-anhydro-N-acetylmuramyl-L-alanine amidase AmpD [Coxiellaceae bacterium]
MLTHFTIDKQTHLINGVTHSLSPNCDQRPDANDISLLVIHGISLPPGQFGGDAITDLFLNRLNPSADPSFAALLNLQVAAHVLIRRDGEVIQYVPFHLRAWHAGQSNFQGRERCNDFSIGIELEGTDTVPYTTTQYEVLAKLTRALLDNYPITLDRIVGHSDIAPGRKTDPGPAFRWDYYRQLLSKENI